jgi:hypothetical protein
MNKFRCQYYKYNRKCTGRKGNGKLNSKSNIGQNGDHPVGLWLKINDIEESLNANLSKIKYPRFFFI